MASNVAFTPNVPFTAFIKLEGTAPAANWSNLDVTDPDTLFAFFSQQMKETRSRLGTMMEGQEQRNRQVQRLQSASASIARFQEEGISPSSPNWKEFVAACNDVKAALPRESKEAREIKAIIDRASKATTKTESGLTYYEACSRVAPNGGTIYDKDGNVVPTNESHPGSDFKVVYNESKGTNPEDIKSVVNKIKALTDGLQTESTMTMIRIQSLVDACSQITSLCTNILKKLSDAQNTAISNIR